MRVRLARKEIRRISICIFIISLITVKYGFFSAIVQGKGDKEVLIAVIDTGIDYTANELVNIKWTNQEEISGDNLDNDNNGYIDDINGWNFYGKNNKIYNNANTYDDHGTHCAGTIASNAGLTDFKIMSLKVLGGAGRTGKIANVIKAIKYAEKMGADICNMSLGSELDNPQLKKVIKTSKMLFVTAAGNSTNGSNLDTKGIYPAAYQLSNLISVANSLEDGSLHPTSNYGSKTVTLAAYGTNIESTLTGGRYGIMTGTSMAAAKVTGIAAFVYGTNPDMKASDAKKTIVKMVDKVDVLSDKLITGGILTSSHLQ